MPQDETGLSGLEVYVALAALCLLVFAAQHFVLKRKARRARESFLAAFDETTLRTPVDALGTVVRLVGEADDGQLGRVIWRGRSSVRGADVQTFAPEALIPFDRARFLGLH